MKETENKTPIIEENTDTTEAMDSITHQCDCADKVNGVETEDLEEICKKAEKSIFAKVDDNLNIERELFEELALDFQDCVGMKASNIRSLAYGLRRFLDKYYVRKES
jgi:hypothetical protein